MSRERLLSEYVPWREYADRNVVTLPGGAVFMMIAVDGLPFETVDGSLIDHRHNQLEAAFRDGAHDGLIYGFLQCRGTADPAIYPQGSFRSAFAAQFDQRYRHKLFGTRSMWLNQTFLYVQIAPRQFGGKWLHTLFRPQNAEHPAARIKRLKDIVAILCEKLKAYHPRILGTVERGRALFSEIAESVAFAMTGYWRAVPLTTSGAASVFSEVFIVGKESFEIRMPHASSWGACLNMHDYPAQTSPGMFDRFLTASYRHTVFHGFRCMAAIDGEAVVTRKQNKNKSAGDRALSQTAELTTAADLIVSNRMLMGEHAFGMTLFSDDLATLPDVIQRGWGDLSAGGIKIERESIALEAVLFSPIPGNFHLRGREAAISSRNFAAFACLHNFPAGARKGFWGDPICMFRTSGGSPYLFHFHHNGVGNCFLSGETGSGKTTLLGFLICQSERSGAQVIFWDKDRGLEAMIRAIEGSYLSLTREPQVAPLKRLTDSVDDLAFLSGLIRACAATPEPYQFTPEEDRRLAIGLRHVMRLPPTERWLEDVRAFLGTSRSGAGARLEKWCRGNEFGCVIDGPRDLVELDGRVIAFDQTDILDDPIASGAILATLFHYTGKLVDGRRLLFVLDEVWKALQTPAFHAVIHNGLKTWRKYNAPIIFATQSVRDALDSPIGHTIREQCPTHLACSSPGAVWADWGPEGVNFTPTEFDIVKKLPQGTGHFLLRQGSRSSVLQAPLSGLSEISVISGTRAGADALKRARELTDDASGTALIEAYLKELEAT